MIKNTKLGLSLISYEWERLGLGGRKGSPAVLGAVQCTS